MKSENLSFRKDVSPLQSGVIKERIKADGRITDIKIRFYSGQERSLRVRPYVLHKNNRAEDVITYAGDSELFLTGDDDKFEFSVSVDTNYDDEFVVWFENIDDTWTYTLVVDVKVIYHQEEGVAV